MQSWENWRTLLAVARHGSYSQAAQTLRVDATTVSRRLKSLTRQLGFEVFVRDGSRLRPTVRCRSLLENLEAADDNLRAVGNLGHTSAASPLRDVRITAPLFLITGALAPNVDRLTGNRPLQVELAVSNSNADLSRRDADIAICIEDRPQDFRIEYERLEPQRIGVLRYAVYVAAGLDPETLPWAGFVEHYVRTTGCRVMADLAQPNGMQYVAKQFDVLREFVAAGVARSVLPRINADTDARLQVVSDTVLEQPLWMFFHHQDRNAPHLLHARRWVVGCLTA